MLSELLSDVVQLVGFATHFNTMRARCTAQHSTAQHTRPQQDSPTGYQICSTRTRIGYLDNVDQP